MPHSEPAAVQNSAAPHFGFDNNMPHSEPAAVQNSAAPHFVSLVERSCKAARDTLAADEIHKKTIERRCQAVRDTLAKYDDKKAAFTTLNIE